MGGWLGGAMVGWSVNQPLASQARHGTAAALQQTHKAPHRRPWLTCSSTKPLVRTNLFLKRTLPPSPPEKQNDRTMPSPGGGAGDR